MDGVLVDTAIFHFQAWKKLANELGIEFNIEHNEQLKGVSRTASLEILLGLGKASFSDSEKEAFASKKNGWFLEYINKMTPADILPGIKDLLQDLSNSGVKIALGSSSKNAPLILEKVGLTPFFDTIVDGNSVAEAKPSPEIFMKGASLLKIDPKDCVVFEDAQSGVEAAKNAGMKCVGVGEDSILGKADVVVATLKNFGLNELSKLS